MRYSASLVAVPDMTLLDDLVFTENQQIFPTDRKQGSVVYKT